MSGLPGVSLLSRFFAKTGMKKSDDTLCTDSQQRLIIYLREKLDRVPHGVYWGASIEMTSEEASQEIDKLSTRLEKRRSKLRR